MLKQSLNDKGYPIVNIAGKIRRVHRLVADRYIPNPDNKPQVNHKDGNKLNNNVSNLEWVTNQENRNHAVKYGLQINGERCPWSKLSKSDVEFIRNNKTLSQRELAAMFNVCQPHISAIIHHENWK